MSKPRGKARKFGICFVLYLQKIDNVSIMAQTKCSPWYWKKIVKIVWDNNMN